MTNRAQTIEKAGNDLAAWMNLAVHRGIGTASGPSESDLNGAMSRWREALALPPDDWTPQEVYDLRTQLAAATKRAEEAEALAAGRLKAVHEKAEEARREWQRAERAEADARTLAKHLATTDELRTWLAKREGFTFGRHELCVRPVWQRDNGDVYIDIDGDLTHPIPASLDTAAALFARLLPGWKWTRAWTNSPGNPASSVLVWRAWTTGHSCEHFDTGNEIHDRFALLVAGLMAQEGAKA